MIGSEEGIMAHWSTYSTCDTWPASPATKAVDAANTAGKPSTAVSGDWLLGVKGGLVRCLALDRAKMNETPASLAGSTGAANASQS
jgi:hypothetical protein